MHSTLFSHLLLLIITTLTFTTALPHPPTRRDTPTVICAVGNNSPLTHDISAALASCNANVPFSGACKNVVSTGTVVVSLCPGTTTTTTPSDLDCAQIAQAVQAIVDGCSRSENSGSGKGATRSAGEADFQGGLKVFLGLRVGSV